MFVLRDDGAALMQHRDDKPGLRDAGRWVPPGGHLDNGETAEQGARRELLEETGYICDELAWLTTLELPQQGNWSAYRLALFWTRYDGVQPVHCLEGQALEFMSRDMAQAFQVPVHLVKIWDQAIAALTSSSRVR